MSVHLYSVADLFRHKFCDLCSQPAAHKVETGDRYTIHHRTALVCPACYELLFGPRVTAQPNQGSPYAKKP